jgi:hypothetical protein
LGSISSSSMIESPGGAGPVGDGETSGIVAAPLPRPRGGFRCWGPRCCARSAARRVFGGQTMAFGKGQFVRNRTSGAAVGSGVVGSGGRALVLLDMLFDGCDQIILSVKSH